MRERFLSIWADFSDRRILDEIGRIREACGHTCFEPTLKEIMKPNVSSKVFNGSFPKPLKSPPRKEVRAQALDFLEILDFRFGFLYGFGVQGLSF